MKIFTLLLVVGVLYHGPSFAVLGENAAAVKVNGAAIRAVYSQEKFAAFTKHELAQKKISVREFADNKSKVFAVAWSGKTHPDLAKLLGSHFAEYRKAYTQAKKTRRGHSPIDIDLGNMHVEQGGAGRSLYGRVWLRDQLPQGANTNDLR